MRLRRPRWSSAATQLLKAASTSLTPSLMILQRFVRPFLSNATAPSLAAPVHQLSACGQELGGDMLFHRRLGFSGTPSDLLPLELGRCHYERGSDGRMLH